MKRKLLIFIIILGLLIIGAVSSIDLLISSQSQAYIFSEIEKTPGSQTVLVLGASVYSNKYMSAMLEDRAKAALEIYQKGKAKKILVSGDNRSDDYNEVIVVQKYLLEQGVPKQDIYLDYAGFDTYDSLYRARDIFKVKNIIIVTQGFHLPRALYIARSLGIDAVGFKVDSRKYQNIEYNILREKLANIKAFFDVVLKAKPTFLGEAIPIQ